MISLEGGNSPSSYRAWLEPLLKNLKASPVDPCIAFNPGTIFAGFLALTSLAGWTSGSWGGGLRFELRRSPEAPGERN